MSKGKNTPSKLLLDILDHYKNHTIQEIIEDIHSKIDNPRLSKKGEQTKVIKDPSLILTEEQIKNLPKNEIASFLKQFSKNELLSFCKNINLKLSTKEGIELISERIVNHYTFINLNKRMADRDATEIPFENNKPDLKST